MATQGGSYSGRVEGAMPPPHGQVANFVNPPNHDAALYGVNGAFIALATLAVGIRVYTRAVVLRHFGWDDAFCLLGWAFAIVYSATIFKAMEYGLGVHLWNVPKTDVRNLGMWIFINENVNLPVWCFIKLSFFWSYKRIFAPRKDAKWLCYGGAFVCVALYVAEVFHDIFICTPVQKNFDSKVKGHCLPSGVGGSVTAIFNVITDFYILILPIPFVLALQMAKHKKLNLLLLFGAGIFVNACSLARCIVTWTLAKQDIAWKFAVGQIWIALELYVALICVSLLVVPAYWERVLLPSWHSLRSKSTSQTATAKTYTQYSRDNVTDPEHGTKLVSVRSQSFSDGSHGASGTFIAQAEHVPIAPNRAKY